MNKLVLWLEIIAVFIAIIVVLIVKVIPEYQASLGSSEKLFTYDNYKTSVEIKIEQGPEFLLIINKNNHLSNIFLENDLANILVNKELEENTIENAIPKIVQILIENNTLENKQITITDYGDKEILTKVVTLFNEEIVKNNKQCNIVTQTSTLQEKAQILNLEETEPDKILWNLYEISYEYMDTDKTVSSPEKTSITKEQAITYMDNIYKKLETYMINKKISNQSVNDISMPIQYIPGDDQNEIYPSTNSWYYIENYKIYAEITIASDQYNYTYCYNGDIQNKKEGMCT